MIVIRRIHNFDGDSNLTVIIILLRCAYVHMSAYNLVIRACEIQFWDNHSAKYRPPPASYFTLFHMDENHVVMGQSHISNSFVYFICNCDSASIKVTYICKRFWVVRSSLYIAAVLCKFMFVYQVTICNDVSLVLLYPGGCITLSGHHIFRNGQ